MSNETKNATGMFTPPGQPGGPALRESDLLAYMEKLAEFVRKFCWRRRRDLSIETYLYFKKQSVPPDLAFRAAKRLTGVVPVLWMTISETRHALQQLGVKAYDKLMYRIRRKVARQGGEIVTIKMNRQRNWDGLDSPALRDPVAILTVRTSGPIHFQVSKFVPKA